jgi:hypothetical protein
MASSLIAAEESRQLAEMTACRMHEILILKYYISQSK